MLLGWLRSREAAAAALSAELAARADARRKAAGDSARAAAIARRNRRSPCAAIPQLTERQLTRLADYLRLALECTDERGITPERERALDIRRRRAARQRRLFARPHPECLTC